MQAVILAGGRGTRLGDVTLRCPKPMVDVDGRPFIEYVVRRLVRSGIREILFSLGYLPETFQAHFGNGTRFGAAIAYSIENEPLGTAGALMEGRERLEDEFWVLNGDTLLELDFHALAGTGRRLGVEACVALRRVPDASRFGSVCLTDERITDFREKCDPGSSGLINAGVYWMRKAVLPSGAPRLCSLERDVFPAVAKKGKLGAFEAAGNFIDIGVPDSLELARRWVPHWERIDEVNGNRGSSGNADRKTRPEVALHLGSHDHLSAD